MNMRLAFYASLVLFSVYSVNAFDDTALQLALDVVDNTIVQTFFNKEGNQEFFNYINKYRQLISQAIRVIKKIDLKSWIRVKDLLERWKVFKEGTLPKLYFDANAFKDKLKNFAFNQEKLKSLMPRFTKSVEAIQKKMNDIGLTDDKLAKMKATMADAMYLMSKVYTVFVYSNMLLKSSALSRFLQRTSQTTESAVAA